MFDESYHWKKNAHPNPSKNHSRNSYCKFFTRYLKTESVIMKTFHLDPLFETQKTDLEVFNQDLAPFVKYSLNKKKRWEAKGGLRLLDDLQKTYDDMDVVVIERMCLRSSPYFCVAPVDRYFWIFFRLFPIRKLHQLDPDESYRLTCTKSIWGQSLKSLLPENRSSEKPSRRRPEVSTSSTRPTVAYHFITPPKNFETLRNNDWRFTSCNKMVHVRRCKNMKDMLLELKHDDGVENLEEDMEDLEDVSDDYDRPRKFYNLEDHLVDRCSNTRGMWSNSRFS